VRRSTAFRLVAFAFMVTMMGTTLPTPLYPLYQDRFGFGSVMVTVVYAVYALGVIGALLLFGSLSDQIGRRWVLLPGLLLSAASAVEFLATGSAAWHGAGGVVTIFAGRVLSGLSAGVFTGTATAALVDLGSKEHPARASLVAAAVNMGGLGLGPLLSGTLVEYGPQPLRLCFAIDLALIAIATIGILRMPEPNRPDGPVRLRVQRLHVPPEIRGTFIQAAAPGFAGFAVLGLFTAISGTLLGQVLHQTNHAVIGLVAFCGFAASLVGQAISATMPERRAMGCGCAVLLLAMGLVAASLAAASLPLLIGAAVTSGIGQGISFRAGLAMVTGTSPPGQRAAVASSFFMTLYIALSIPVIGVGAAAQSFGWVRAGIAFAVLVGLLPLVALISLLRRPQRPLELPAAPARIALPAAPHSSPYSVPPGDAAVAYFLPPHAAGPTPPATLPRTRLPRPRRRPRPRDYRRG
jgi:MFS family permease